MEEPAGPVRKYNMKNAGVKRLMREAAELRDPTDLYYAQPLEDNLFEWHFTVRGPADTDFDGGIYHGRIILPVDYPMKPPSVILLTPNGRFQLNQKICLSISGHHPESWQPSWSIRTALLALIGFMPTHGAGALGALEYPPEERRKLAKLSRDWVCKSCGLRMSDALLGGEPNKSDVAEARELAKQISFKNNKETKTSEQVKEAELSETNRSETIPTTTVTTTSPPNAHEGGDHVQAANLDANSNIIMSTSTRWEIFAIWFLSALIAGLIFRRFIFLENPWAA